MSLLSPPLEAFWAVVRKGTVQDASLILGITQTGVTQRIRSLEKQLKTTLFIRSRKGMRLTTEGEALLQYVKSSLDIEGMALSKIQRAARENIIEIGITGSSSILRSRVIPNLSNLQLKFPLLRFRYELNDSDTQIENLKSGATDFAIVEHHQVGREMDSKVLKPEKYKIYGSASWKRRSFEKILQEEPIVDFNQKDRMTFSFLNKYKLKFNVILGRYYANNTDAIASMLASGLGYSVLSEEFAKPFVKRGEIVDLMPEGFYDHKIALAWYPRNERPDYFDAIIKGLH